MKTKFSVFLALFLMFAISGTGKADTVYANLGPLSLPIPWENMNAVYLYNLTAHESQIGGEMVLAEFKIGTYKNAPINLDATGGGVINANSNNVGSAFVGFHLSLPNPTAQFMGLSAMQPGLFGGYSINFHRWEWGLKAAFSIFRG